MIQLPVKDNKKILIQGIEHELFYVGHLAFALGRSVQTIRKWEIAGIIPPTIFKDKFNRRLYTQEQIGIMVTVAEECAIKQGSSIANTPFSRRVHKAIDLLNKKYLNKDGN